LASPEFRASQRCQDFLRFVVEQSLAGHADSLKERTIGVEAFGRAADYETNLDGVVHSLIPWNPFHQISPFQLRLLSIVRQ
jgi:hypothetical protein